MNILKALFGSGEIKDTKKADSKERDFEILKYDGVRAMRTGAMEQARKCFEGALNLNNDFEIRDYLSLVLVSLGDLEEAVSQLRMIAEVQPDNVKVFLRMASIYYMLEDYENMDVVATTALQIDGEEPVAMFQLAQASRGKGDVVKAVAMLTKALSIDDSYEEAYLLRGEMLLKAGDAQAASSDVEWLMEHDSCNEDVMMLKARYEHACGNDDNAIDAYGKVIDMNPFSSQAYKERGAVFMRKGDTKAAAADMQTSMEICPEMAADINGEYSAEGIERMTKDAYGCNPLCMG